MHRNEQQQKRNVDVHDWTDICVDGKFAISLHIFHANSDNIVVNTKFVDRKCAWKIVKYLYISVFGKLVQVFFFI